MLRLATSGLKVAAGLTRSSIDTVGAPPGVMLITAAQRCLMTLRNGANASGDWSGRPSFGSRAWRCTTAAPAFAAPLAASATAVPVPGSPGDIDGVWIEPVTAQVIMTLFLAAIVPPGCLFVLSSGTLDGGGRTRPAPDRRPRLRDTAPTVPRSSRTRRD